GDVLEPGMRLKHGPAQEKAEKNKRRDVKHQRRPARGDQRADGEGRKRTDEPEQKAEAKPGRGHAEVKEDRDAERKASVAQGLRVVRRQRQSEQREADIIPKFAGERPQGRVRAERRHQYLSEV